MPSTLKMPDYVILKIDYSQLELRLIGDQAGVRGLIDEYAKGLDADVHARTAASLHEKDQSLITKAERKEAKPINFGVSYGMQARTFQINLLDYDLYWDIEKCQKAIDAFAKAYPEYVRFKQGIEKQFWDAHVAYLAGEGPRILDIYNALGRVRRFDLQELIDTGRIKERYDYKTKKKTRFVNVNDAINFKIQGLAAPSIKLAMIRADELIKEHGLDAKLLLQVHDELVYKVHRNHVGKALDVIGRQAMVEYPQQYIKTVPLAIEAEIGGSWGNTTPVKQIIGKAPRRLKKAS